MKAIHMFSYATTFPTSLVTACARWIRYDGIQHTKDPAKVTCKRCIALLAERVTQRLKS